MENYKTNPWVHTVYLNIILLIVLFFVIVLMTKGRISENAMANVSFAATIVSIVLAVISIVISVVASFKTYQNLGGMQDMVNRMNLTISKLNKIGHDVTITGRRVEDLQELLKPTPQSEINNEAEKTLAGINAETTKDKKILTIDDVKKYERKAVISIAKENELSNLMFDYRLSISQNFDGIARKGDENWLIEIKLFKPKLVADLISRLKRTKHQVMVKTEEPVEVIVGYLLTDTSDKKILVETYTPKFVENGLKVRFYYLNELL